MISGVTLFFLGHHHGLALGAHHDFILGLVELFHANQSLAATGGEQRGLVNKVRQISTRKTRRASRDDAGIYVVGNGHLTHVHLGDLLATTNIR